MAAEHPAWLEIDTRILARNVRALVRFAHPSKVITVIKANACGHGVREIARVFDRAGAFKLGVYGVDELRQLDGLKLRSPVLNLCYPFKGDVEEIVRRRALQAVWDLPAARALSRAAKSVVSVHVKVDTGLHRVGVPWREARAFCGKIRRLPRLRIDGIFTTLSEKPGTNQEQVRIFRETTEGLDIPCRHLATSGGLSLREGFFDAIRVGLIAFGYQPIVPQGVALDVRPALRFIARIVAIRRLMPGETCGYGGLFTAIRPSVIGVVSAGFADGLWRSLSNRWRCELGGRTVPLVGRLSTNHHFIDMTSAPGKVGDAVTVFGGESNTLPDLARMVDTAAYEVLARLNPRLPRVYR